MLATVKDGVRGESDRPRDKYDDRERGVSSWGPATYVVCDEGPRGDTRGSHRN